jgi:thiamine-phosphate pyrophosphorylase
VNGDERRAALDRARVYLICDAGQIDRAPLDAIDVLQLREKADLPRSELLATARRAARRCGEAGVVFIVNDDPRLAREAGADGVHVGQDDMSVAAARLIVGDELVVGRSTHTPAQVDAAAGVGAAAGVDYIGVGPVYATPTKPGRPAVGLELVAYAARHARVPFFAIGGVDGSNVAAVRAAGAKRIAVVRAIAAAVDPRAAARSLREACLAGAG